MKKGTIILLTIVLTLVEMTSCHSGAIGHSNNVDTGFKKTDTGSYAAKFNASYHDQLILLGCMVYAKNATKKLRYDTIADFLEIATRFVVSVNPDKNVDSVIDAFISSNAKVDFKSNEAEHSINNFGDNYNIVSAVIFGKIDSDDKVDEMKVLEEKIKKVPEVFKIYNSYMEGRPDLSSLSSGEGSALFIELASYLSNQDINKRNKILKELL